MALMRDQFTRSNLHSKIDEYIANTLIEEIHINYLIEILEEELELKIPPRMKPEDLLYKIPNLD